MLKTAYIVSIFLFAVTACNEKDFTRGGGDGVKPKRNALQAECQPGMQASQGRGEFSSIKKVSVDVKGEFCAIDLNTTQAPLLTVLAIVDQSGSMRGSGAIPGADPLVAGSCGRLQAMNAVLEKKVPPGITDANGNPPNVQFGSVSFGSQAKIDIDFTHISQVGEKISADLFCGGYAGGTNYEDAFVTAASMIENIIGPKVVYFITDGFPSTSGTTTTTAIQNLFSGSTQYAREAYNKGVEGAQILLSVPETSLNVVYLRPNGVQTRTSSSGFNPEQYLSQIAGNDPNRVQPVDNASNLAQKIVLLEAPDPSQIEAKNVQGTLSAPGFKPKKVDIELSREPTPDGKYQWRGKIEPFCANDRNVVNTLTVTAMAADGQNPTSVYEIVCRPR